MTISTLLASIITSRASGKKADCRRRSPHGTHGCDVSAPAAAAPGFSRRSLLRTAAVLTASGVAGHLASSALASSATASTSNSAALEDLTEVAFTDSAGTSSWYNVYGAHLSGKPSGLIVYLHGDGFGEFNSSSTVLEGYAATARRHHMLLVAPVTPDRTTKTWWKADSSTTWLVELLKEITHSHPIDTSKVWLAGYSGGAEEITNSLMTDHSDLFTGGGALMVGGGSLGPEVAFGLEPSDELKQGFHMMWLVGELDTPSRGGSDGGFDAFNEAKRARARFIQAGMKKTTFIPLNGVDHNTSVHRGASYLSGMISRG